MGNFTAAEQRAITRANNIIKEKASLYANDGREIDSSNRAGQIARFELANEIAESVEGFLVLYLNTQHRIINKTKNVGTINTASVWPREVARKCLEFGAAAVIIAHNHPSGLVDPSDSDQMITKRLKDSLDLFDIPVLDHVIVTTTETYSFAQYGLMS